MTIFTNTAEGGTNGTTVNISNSGGASGSAFDQVTAGVTFSTAAKAHGNLGYTGNSGTQFTRWSTTDSTVLARVYYRSSDPTFGGCPIRVNLQSGSVFISIMDSANAGRIQLYSAGGVATSPSAISSNTLYRFELYVKAGSGNGELRCAVYLGDSTTAWWDSGAQTGRTVENPVTLLYGKYDGAAITAHWDDLGAKTGSDAVWGAWPVTSGTPNANAGGYVIVQPGSSFTLNGTSSSSPNGTITNWSWTSLWPSGGAPSLTNATTSSATGTAGSNGSIYAYRLTITDSTSATDTDTVNVLVTNGGSGSEDNADLIWDGDAWI